jgi:hypothetical protein
MLGDPENAVLFRHGDVDDLVQTWIALLRDRPRREKLATQARHYAVNHRNAQSMARDTDRVLSSFIKSSS